MKTKTQTFIWLIILAVAFTFACKPEKPSDNAELFFKNNLVAWCVVPFDSMERTPVQRAQMLKELGFTKFAYDWRANHLPDFPVEIGELKKQGIQLSAVWIWINSDSLLDQNNARIFDIVKENNVRTDFWVGFNNAVFEGLDNNGKFEKAVSMVKILENRASEQGCTISLYNHGDWFGEPATQIKIIEQTGSDKIGMVYNFHHAHEQIADFPVLLPKMLPYLKTVNLNGMRAEGPKILPIGQGDAELEMLKILKESGYDGQIGILGHVENVDVRLILQGNLDGLKSLLGKLGEDEAVTSYN
ncbi:MAG: xylose isomerase [Cyclobacteriaceae bacterium]|nr:xylose isomerase [Cyclobacteriaceae bacterium]